MSFNVFHFPSSVQKIICFYVFYNTLPQSTLVLCSELKKSMTINAFLVHHQQFAAIQKKKKKKTKNVETNTTGIFSRKENSLHDCHWFRAFLHVLITLRINFRCFFIYLLRFPQLQREKIQAMCHMHVYNRSIYFHSSHLHIE